MEQFNFCVCVCVTVNLKSCNSVALLRNEMRDGQSLAGRRNRWEGRFYFSFENAERRQCEVRCAGKSIHIVLMRSADEF